MLVPCVRSGRRVLVALRCRKEVRGEKGGARGERRCERRKEVREENGYPALG